MAPIPAQKRLSKEYKAIQANPPPFITAQPSETNILEWHFVIMGPPETPYEGGQYHGTLVFPSEYPFKPPSIRYITPSGRFKPNTRLCMSMSDYHPDLWNPGWSVSTILTGLLSFMTDDELTTGAISTSDDLKVKYARNSRVFNNQSDRFKLHFPNLVAENIREIAIQERENRERLVKLEKIKEEKVASVESITDPEDKIRAMSSLSEPRPQFRLLPFFIVTTLAVMMVGVMRTISN